MKSFPLKMVKQSTWNFLLYFFSCFFPLLNPKFWPVCDETCRRETPFPSWKGCISSPLWFSSSPSPGSYGVSSPWPCQGTVGAVPVKFGGCTW